MDSLILVISTSAPLPANFAGQDFCSAAAALSESMRTPSGTLPLPLSAELRDMNSSLWLLFVRRSTKPRPVYCFVSLITFWLFYLPYNGREKGVEQPNMEQNYVFESFVKTISDLRFFVEAIFLPPKSTWLGFLFLLCFCSQFAVYFCSQRLNSGANPLFRFPFVEPPYAQRYER